MAGCLLTASDEYYVAYPDGQPPLASLTREDNWTYKVTGEPRLERLGLYVLGMESFSLDVPYFGDIVWKEGRAYQLKKDGMGTDDSDGEDSDDDDCAEDSDSDDEEEGADGSGFGVGSFLCVVSAALSVLAITAVFGTVDVFCCASAFAPAFATDPALSSRPAGALLRVGRG